jgi:hypothetical protein
MSELSSPPITLAVLGWTQASRCGNTFAFTIAICLEGINVVWNNGAFPAVVYCFDFVWQNRDRMVEPVKLVLATASVTFQQRIFLGPVNS